MRRLSYPLSVLLFGPLAFFWPFAGGSGPFDLGPAPLRLGTCATSWTEGVYWSPRRGLFPSSSGHKRGSLGFALPLLRGTDRLMTTKSLAGTIYNIVWLSGLSFFVRGAAFLLLRKIDQVLLRLFGASVKQAAACLHVMISASASGPICPAGRHCHGDYRAAASFAVPRTLFLFTS